MSSLQTEEQYIGEAAHEAAHEVHVTVEEAHDEAAHEAHVAVEEAHEVHVTVEEAHEAAHDEAAQPKKRARVEQAEMRAGIEGHGSGITIFVVDECQDVTRNSGSGITMANAFQGGGRCD